jgi:hypothetical protein
MNDMDDDEDVDDLDDDESLNVSSVGSCVDQLVDDDEFNEHHNISDGIRTCESVDNGAYFNCLPMPPRLDHN